MSMGGAGLRGFVFAILMAIVSPHAIAQDRPAATRRPDAVKQVSPPAMMVVQTTQVPNLVGQPESRVSSLLARAHLDLGSSVQRPSDAAAGTVISQTPQADSNARLGASVSIVVSSGPREQPQQPRRVDVPNVVGTPLALGELMLARQRLRTGRVDQEPATAANGTIVRQNPDAGSSVERGSAIDLVVSAGSDPSPATQVRVPNLVGRPIGNAASILGTARLDVGRVTRKRDAAAVGTILDQSPSPRALVSAGSGVDVTVSLGNDAGPDAPNGPNTPDRPGRVPDVVKRMFPSPETTSILGRATLQIGVVVREDDDSPFGTILEQVPAAGTPVVPNSRVGLVVSRGPAQSTPPPLTTTTPTTTPPVDTTSRQTVPNVVGLASPVASDRLSQSRFTSNARRIAATQPEGIVVAQRPGGGARASAGSSVAIDLSDGSLVVVPRVVGRSAAAADELIAQAGLRADRSTQPANAVPDTVIAQEPAADATVPRETAVRVVVAIARTVPVPDVVGLPIGDARARIGANLKAEATSVDSMQVPVDHVVATDPVAGTMVPVGSLVRIDASLGPPPLPDFTGKTIDQVRDDARTAGVPLAEPQHVFDAAPSGTVLRQSVPPRTRSGPDAAVTLVVSRGPLWPWVATTIVAVAVLLVGAAAAALWPPVRYRVLVKNHKVSASTDALEIEGPSIEMRVRVEHGGRTLNEEP